MKRIIFIINELMFYHDKYHGKTEIDPKDLIVMLRLMHELKTILFPIQQTNKDPFSFDKPPKFKNLNYNKDLYKQLVKDLLYFLIDPELPAHKKFIRNIIIVTIFW